MKNVTTGEVRIHGESQGYKGLAVRHETTYDPTRKDEYENPSEVNCMITEWALEPYELAALVLGSVIKLQTLGNLPQPMRIEVTDIPEASGYQLWATARNQAGWAWRANPSMAGNINLPWNFTVLGKVSKEALEAEGYEVKAVYW